MLHERIRFDNGRGQTLAARLDQPADGPPTACVLFAHCFTCSNNLKAVGAISRALTEEGFAVLRFDFTGLGESEGDFAETSFSSNVGDLVAAAAYMEDAFEAPSILVGHSLGGAAVLQAAAQLPRVKAVATIGAPHDPEHVTRLLDGAREAVEATGEARVTLAGRAFRITKPFLDDLEGRHMDAVIGSLDRPLLVFHAPLDQTVGVENARAIFEAARHPKSFVSLDQADHLLTREADARYVGTVLAAWARTYIDATPGEATRAPERDGFQVAARTGQGYRTEIAARDHALVADEPRKLGGTDTGPTPYDLLSAALAACKTLTLRMYADRKEWPMEEVTVRVSHRKIQATDCDHCETTKGKLDRFEVEVDVTGDLTDAQRQRLYEIADRCPVHRTFQGEIDIQSALREPEKV
jgi:putative redox protein